MKPRLPRRRFLSLAGGLGAGALLGPPAAFGYARVLERRFASVEERPCPFPGLPPAFEGFRLGVLGDIHIDPLYDFEFVESCVERLNRQKPDAVVLTGDFVSHDATRLRDLVTVLKALQAPSGVFAILGNHDHWTDADGVERAFDQNGIRMLRNSRDSLVRGDGSSLAIAGLESVWGGQPDLDRALRGVEREEPVLLAMHEPDYFNVTRHDPRVRFQVSGHTHGGQVRVPALGAILLPKFGRNFQAGLYRREGKSLYVNRGLGTIGPHVRFCCRPEISLLRLVPA